MWGTTRRPPPRRARVAVASQLSIKVHCPSRCHRALPRCALDVGNPLLVALVERPLLDPLAANQPRLREDAQMLARRRLTDAELVGDEEAADAVFTDRHRPVAGIARRSFNQFRIARRRSLASALIGSLVETRPRRATSSLPASPLRHLRRTVIRNEVRGVTAPSFSAADDEGRRPHRAPAHARPTTPRPAPRHRPARDDPRTVRGLLGLEQTPERPPTPGPPSRRSACSIESSSRRPTRAPRVGRDAAHQRVDQADQHEEPPAGASGPLQFPRPTPAWTSRSGQRSSRSVRRRQSGPG